jgi:hypothetical protein
MVTAILFCHISGTSAVILFRNKVEKETQWLKNVSDVENRLDFIYQVNFASDCRKITPTIRGH